MSYQNIKDGIIKDIVTRKEFYSLKLPERKDFNIAGIISSNKYSNI